MKKIWFIGSFLYFGLLFCLVIPFKKYEITLPGNITDVSENLDFNNDIKGHFFTTYVISYYKPTIIQILAANLAKEASLKENKQASYYYDSFLDEELSFQYATINSYNAAKEINELIKINYEKLGYAIVISKNKAILGDIITEINDFKLNDKTIDELNDYLKDFDEINVKALRKGKIVTYSLKKELGLFNLSLKPYFVITNLNPTYLKLYDKDKIGGPSGGLIQALFIYYQITNKEITKKIGGTGTININGEVGPIGGITQKIYTVNNKIEIFFCPKIHQEEALAAYNKLKNPSFKLVFVDNFLEALEYLEYDY